MIIEITPEILEEVIKDSMADLGAIAKKLNNLIYGDSPGLISIKDIEGKGILTNFRIDKDATQDEKMLMSALSAILGNDYGFNAILGLAETMIKNSQGEKPQCSTH